MFEYIPEILSAWKREKALFFSKLFFHLFVAVRVDTHILCTYNLLFDPVLVWFGNRLALILKSRFYEIASRR